MRRYPAHFGIAAYVHREIDGSLTLAKGHDIARQAKLKAMARHPVLGLMTHGDPVTPVRA
jgi:divalent metal cation (Fe/Co/Zn/Cd) transporter